MNSVANSLIKDVEETLSYEHSLGLMLSDMYPDGDQKKNISRVAFDVVIFENNVLSSIKNDIKLLNNELNQIEEIRKRVNNAKIEPENQQIYIETRSFIEDYLSKKSSIIDEMFAEVAVLLKKMKDCSLKRIEELEKTINSRKEDFRKLGVNVDDENSIKRALKLGIVFRV